MIAAQSRVDYRPVAVAFTTFILFGMVGSLLNVAWPFIRDTFGVTIESFGLLAFPATIASMTASFLSGRLVARVGVGRMLALATLAIGTGYLLYGVAPSWEIIIAVTALAGIGTGLLDSGLNLYFAQNHSPRLMNWLHACFGLGAVFGPLLMTWVVESGIGWRVGYVIAAVTMLIITLFYAFTASWWRARIHEGDAPIDTPPMRATLSQPLVWLSIILFLLMAGIETSAAQWSFSLFTEARGAEVAVAGFWTSFYWASFTLGRIIFGFIADRIAVQFAIRACMVGIIFGALLLWWNPVDIVSYIGLAIIGFAMAPIFPLMTSTTPDRLGRGHANNAVGFQVGAAGLGIAVLPTGAGLLAGWLSLEVIGPFLVGSGVLMLVLYLMLGSRRIRS